MIQISPRPPRFVGRQPSHCFHIGTFYASFPSPHKEGNAACVSALSDSCQTLQSVFDIADFMNHVCMFKPKTISHSWRNIYLQVHRIAMGAPMAPSTAQSFLCHFLKLFKSSQSVFPWFIWLDIYLINKSQDQINRKILALVINVPTTLHISFTACGAVTDGCT